MLNLYNLFKFLHITGAIVWIGGAFTLVVLNARLARSQNRAVVEALAQQSSFYGRAVLGPAAAATLLAGIGTAIFMGVRFTALWILWGLAGIFLSMLLGSVFIGRTTGELSRAAAAPEPDPSRLAAFQRRLASLNLLNLLLLLSVVAVMVFKFSL
jgi:uncharacterized membrane protein